MNMSFLFAVLLLLDLTVYYSENAKFTIIPSPNSPCPGEFTGEPCLTLQQYVANPSLSSNTTLELLVGNHHLNSRLEVSSINSFTIKANTSATVTITCSYQISGVAFYFHQTHQIHISGITFISCDMFLQYITNAKFEKNSLNFMSLTRCCSYSSALAVQYSSVQIRLCSVSFSRRYHGTVINSDRSNLIIEQSTIYIRYYSGSSDTYGPAAYLRGGNLNILNSNFSGNSISCRNGHGGAIYASDARVTITGSSFTNTRAGSSSGHGGAIYFDGSSITVTNCTFINNAAPAGGGGAIYSARRNAIVSLVNNIFSHNTAAYCGVIDVDEFYHYNVIITGNTFIYNRAVGLVAGNNGGGVICIRNASMTISGNNFSHNSAAGNAGVIRIDESEIVIKKSIFNNNTAGGDGGVFHTSFYPNRYTINHSTFTNNRAGGDGGVMYVGRAGSHVIINQSTFSYNHAHARGGVVAILGSTLQIDETNSFVNNTAELGKVISACKSNVTLTDADSHFLAFQDPIVTFCTLYDSYNSTTPPITAPNIIVTESTTVHQAEEGTSNNDITTTTLASTNEFEATTTEGKHRPSTTIATSIDTTLNGDVSPTTQTSTPTTIEGHPTTLRTKDDNTSNPASEAVTAKDNNIIMNTIPVVPGSGKINLHTIIPGYASLGLSAVLLIFFILMIIVMVLRKKPKPPSTRSRKNEYTLIEVQAKEMHKQ